MAKRVRFKAAARKIGAAIGKADRTARKLGKAAQVAREDLAELTKQIEGLARQLKKTGGRLKRTLR